MTKQLKYNALITFIVYLSVSLITRSVGILSIDNSEMSIIDQMIKIVGSVLIPLIVLSVLFLFTSKEVDKGQGLITAGIFLGVVSTFSTLYGLSYYLRSVMWLSMLVELTKIVIGLVVAFICFNKGLNIGGKPSSQVIYNGLVISFMMFFFTGVLNYFYMSIAYYGFGPWILGEFMNIRIGLPMLLCVLGWVVLLRSNRNHIRISQSLSLVSHFSFYYTIYILGFVVTTLLTNEFHPDNPLNLYILMVPVVSFVMFLMFIGFNKRSEV